MERSIMDTILLLNEQCCHLGRQAVDGENLLHREFRVLLSIETGETVSGTDLARRNGLSPSRMSRLIDSLASKGFLAREIDPDDRRFTRLSLTPAGRKKMAEALAFKEVCESKIRARLSDHEFGIIQKALNILSYAMENENGEQPYDPASNDQ